MAPILLFLVVFFRVGVLLPFIMGPPLLEFLVAITLAVVAVFAMAEQQTGSRLNHLDWYVKRRVHRLANSLERMKPMRDGVIGLP